MKIKFGRTLVLLSFMPALLGMGPSPLFLNRKSVKPGQVIKIQIPIQSDTPPNITWKNKSYPFQRSYDNFWRLLLPIPVDQEAGEEIFYFNPNSRMSGEYYEGSINIQINAADLGETPVELEGVPSHPGSDSKSGDESKLIAEMINAGTTDPNQYWRGLFVWPVSAPVLAHYGFAPRRMGQKQEDFHPGLDLQAAKGAPVFAPNAGVVLLAKEFNQLGKTIIINHGQGVISLFYYLDSIAVEEGGRVDKSQSIGTAGTTPFGTRSFVHWELHVQGQTVDPLQWLEEEF